MSGPTQGERIAALEVQVAYAKLEIAELKGLVEAQNKKLDELLTLKNKGAGAFWLASLVVGTGIAGLIAQIVHWFRN